MGNVFGPRLHSVRVTPGGAGAAGAAGGDRGGRLRNRNGWGRLRNRWHTLGELVHLASQPPVAGQNMISLEDLMSELCLHRGRLLGQTKASAPSDLEDQAGVIEAEVAGDMGSMGTSSAGDLCPHQIRQQLQYIQRRLHTGAAHTEEELLIFRPAPCLSCAQPLRRAIHQNPMLLQLLVIGPLQRDLPRRLAWANLSLMKDVAGVLEYLIQAQPRVKPQILPPHPSIGEVLERPAVPYLDLVWALRGSGIGRRLQESIGVGTRRQSLESPALQGIAGEMHRTRAHLWRVLDVIEGRDLWLKQLWAFAAAACCPNAPASAEEGGSDLSAAGRWMRDPMWDPQLLRHVFHFVWQAT